LKLTSCRSKNRQIELGAAEIPNSASNRVATSRSRSDGAASTCFSSQSE
jgi:hypothetical protein